MTDLSAILIQQLEVILNKIGSIVIGALLIEYGLCRWQNRPFTKKNVWTFIVIIYGAGLALKSFCR